MKVKTGDSSHGIRYVNGARLFDLVRDEDVSGVSGTGIVAQGIQFGDGVCVLRWCVPPVASTAVYDSLVELVAIHGHDGRTRIAFLAG